MQRCFFSGHNMYYDNRLKERLYCECEMMIKNGVKEFFIGNYGNFDRLAANILKKLKKKYSEIEICLIIPYLTSAIKNNKDYYKDTFDKIIIPDLPKNTPVRYKIIETNEYMADNSRYLICYVEHDWGGAAKTVEYAKRKGLKIVNLHG